MQLDTDIYMKDGYIMLPVRTVFSAINADTVINWNNDKKIANVVMENKTGLSTVN